MRCLGEPAALRRGALLACAGLIGILAALPAPAGEVRLLVQSSPLAGFRYHDAGRVFAANPHPAQEPVGRKIEPAGRQGR